MVAFTKNIQVKKINEILAGLFFLNLFIKIFRNLFCSVFV